MKYIIIPIWRILTAIVVLIYQLCLCIIYVLGLLYYLTLPDVDFDYLWFPIRHESLFAGPDTYYKNAYHALINRITYMP